MLTCKKCNGRIFVDRQYVSQIHIEIYCIRCGLRKIYHPAKDTLEGRWFLEKETLRAKSTITSL